LLAGPADFRFASQLDGRLSWRAGADTTGRAGSRDCGLAAEVGVGVGIAESTRDGAALEKAGLM
jgi:hypothetical protein